MFNKINENYTMSFVLIKVRIFMKNFYTNDRIGKWKVCQEQN